MSRETLPLGLTLRQGRSYQILLSLEGCPTNSSPLTNRCWAYEQQGQGEGATLFGRLAPHQRR